VSSIPTVDGKRVYRNYSPDLPRKWDVVVVGSGMGGMACATALGKSGRKVLVLEQHYVPGGFTHMFARKGFHWDAGVHAMGEMLPHEIPGKVLRWLTDGRVEMLPLGDPYDRFRFHDGFEWGLPASRDAWVSALRREFPDQHAAIDRYLNLVSQAARSAMSFFAFKSFPEVVDVVGSRVVSALSQDFWGMTTEQALDQCGVQGRLRTVLTLHWGYYGSIPRESAFPIHALTHSHFWNGAYYPRGGSKMFAAHMLDAVRRAGGDTVVRADVSRILVENGRAVGVGLKDGTEVRAPVIVSAAGAKATVNKLVPKPLRHSEWGRSISALRDSPPYICLNLGFEGDIRAGGATPANLWLFETWAEDAKLWRVDDPAAIAPILYCSFPSLKDPDHDPGPKQRHTGECITFVDWGLFARYAEGDPERRPVDYQALKRDIEERLLAHLRRRIPDVMQHLVYQELSTPITTEHFTRASRGAIYGLEASPDRFKCTALRTRTPLPNFYMTGSDVASLGVVGAMTSGMLTAATIDPRIYRRLL